MNQTQKPKAYDLENRSKNFALNVRNFTKIVPKSIHNIEYIKQIIRSSGSVAANYIEANEALSKKDFLIRIKICRKEAKETILWLELLDINTNQGKTKAQLIQETTELMKIFGSIVVKSSEI